MIRFKQFIKEAKNELDTLPHDHPKRRENLMKWFGNSVTHDNGVPRTYYTGTSKDVDFKSFNVGRHGAWFTSDPKEASQYSVENDSMGSTWSHEKRGYEKTNVKSRVIPAHIKAENPYRGPIPDQVFSQNYKKSQSDWFDTLRAKGHDSWIPDHAGGNLVVVLKHPNQIKSSIGNKGQFDSNKKNIHEEKENESLDSYKASYSGREGQYNTKYFTKHNDDLKDKEGNIVGSKDKLIPTKHLNDFPSIVDSDDHMYRGISHAEYENFKKTGEIKSNNSYNFSTQTGLTYFSTDHHTASRYSNGFAPEKHKPTWEKPAYIVVAKKPTEKDITTINGTNRNEIGVNRPIHANEIVAIHRGTVVAHDPEVNTKGYKQHSHSHLHWEKIHHTADKIHEEIDTHYKHLPAEPGTTPIPDGHIRLYHRTSISNMKSIANSGLSIDHAKGYEGPKAIYADPKGFYGKPGDIDDSRVDVEFHVPINKFKGTIVHMDEVPKENIIAIHQNWHNTARSIRDDPKTLSRVLSGKHDNLLDGSGGDQYKYSIKHIKHIFKESKIPHDRDTSENTTSLDEYFDIIEQMVIELSEIHNVDPDIIWDDFENVDDVELYETAAWRRKEGKSETGGLNKKGVESYRRENPGSNLQMAVTTKPSELKKDSKAYKRRKSFCARMSGVKGPMRKPNGEPSRKALALRKWNC